MKFDQSSAICQVFVFREGLLSVLGHDLRIKVTSFVIEIDEAYAIEARFDARSLQVDCAMVDGAERPDVLSLADKNEIDRNILRKVLESDIYGDISLTSALVRKEDSSYLVNSTLTLHGTSKQIAFTVRKEGNYNVADFGLHLPDFGITPFSALFGMIKIKPDILIRVMIPDGPAV